MNIIGMDFLQFLEIGGVLFAAAILQSIAGFGFSLFLLPVLLSMGVMLPQAVTVGIVCSAAQRTYSIRKMNDHIDWKTLWPMMITGLIALPFGILILKLLTFVKMGHVRQMIGALILLTLAAQLFRIKQRDKIPQLWGHIAAFISGVLNGLGNIGGPPIVLWILAHNWPAAKMRVTTLAYTLVFVPFQLIILICVFKMKILQAGAIALAYAPLVLIATGLGLRIGHRLNQKNIRLIMQVLLLVIAMLSIVKPMLD